jgi:MFS family permease
MLYLVISSLPTLWEERYNMPKGVASLNYLALVGSLIGAQLCGPVADAIHKHLRKKHGFENGKGLPEFRIPLMIPASILNAAGIFLFGWSAQAKLHWIVPDVSSLSSIDTISADIAKQIGIALFGGANMICYLLIQIYLVDTYTRYSASASAAACFLRSIAALTFPLFAPYLFQNLGYGWGCTVLGSICVCLGIPAPILLWKFGARLRACSLYAAHD